ncbi:MAG: hypothetical protein ACJ786_24615 [Catenulispora sp.]
MEFAKWVVSGLDQLRLGRLPGGGALYQAVSAGLGDSTVLDAYLNSGDPAAREQLVQAIAQALAADPGFEQQVRQAAANAQSGSSEGAPAEPTKPSFFKTTNGLPVLVAAAVVVVGGGIGLAVGLSGDSSSAVIGMMKGTWKCVIPKGGDVSLAIGDGSWSDGYEGGAWKQSGSKLIVSEGSHPGEDVILSDLPSHAGSFNLTITSPLNATRVAHLTGTISTHKLTVNTGSSDGTPSAITCTK